MTLLPADLQPFPAHASGMMALRASAIGQYAITLRRSSNGATLNASFGSDGRLPLSEIDAFRAPEPPIGLGSTKTGIVRVIERRDQISGVPSINTNYMVGSGNAPRFADLTIGQHRCMWMESDCMTGNESPTGNIEVMRASTLSSLNIPQNAMTVMQVLQLHNSTYSDQTAGPYRGCVFATDWVSPPDLFAHTRIFSEHFEAANPGRTRGGGFVVEDDLGLRMQPVNAWVDTTPFVMTYITGPGGTFIGQNEDIRSVAASPAGANVAAEAFIGCHHESFPTTMWANNTHYVVGTKASDLEGSKWSCSVENTSPATGTFAAYRAANPSHWSRVRSEAMGMAELLTMIWPQTLTMREAATIRAAIYDVAGIDFRHSHSNAPLIALFNDSIWTGYKPDDLRGWDKIAAAQLPTNVRWANWAVPGTGYIQNPASPYYGSSAVQSFPGWMAQAIRQHRGKVHCCFGAAVNDFYDGSITAQHVYDNGILKLISLIREIDPTTTFTLCTGTRSATPNSDQKLGDTGTLIMNGAAANGYGVVDLRSDSVMGVQPPPGGNLIYKDGTHLGVAGCERWAELMLPRLKSWLTSVGVPS